MLFGNAFLSTDENGFVFRIQARLRSRTPHRACCSAETQSAGKATGASFLAPLAQDGDLANPATVWGVVYFAAVRDSCRVRRPRAP